MEMFFFPLGSQNRLEPHSVQNPRCTLGGFILGGSVPLEPVFTRHDRFRGVEGAFEGALCGIRLVKDAGIEFQINTTITKINLDEIPKIQELAIKSGAVAHHIFLLVPTGRGKYIVDQEINAAEYENTCLFHPQLS
jgi:MoaA/NifB/PqqE/SkfB family radical SAM enzyme